MKKVAVCLVVIFAVLSFVGLTTAYAWPYLEVEAFVDPYSAVTIFDNGTTTTFSDVTYSFVVTKADPWSVMHPGTLPEDDMDSFMNFVSLEFENDVFASVGGVSFSSPSDWSYSPAGDYELATAGTVLGAGEKLTFTVSDVVVYNDALLGTGLWQEGQMWAQSFTAGDTLGGNDGGSTTLVPEPGTLLLFGSGLVGLFYVRRSKVFNT